MIKNEQFVFPNNVYGITTTVGYPTFIISKKDYEKSQHKNKCAYLRAEPVEALLKQARDEIHHMVDSDGIPYGNNVAFKKLITAIDKLLGETK